MLMIIFALAMCALFRFVYHHEVRCRCLNTTPTPWRVVQHQRDSIYLSDSIYVNDFVRDDTVYKTVERWHTQYRDRWRTDTIYQSKLDSIPYPVEVEKKVPAELTWWQQTRWYLANTLLVVLGLLASDGW